MNRRTGPFACLPLLALAACRLNPACFGTDECPPGFVCQAQRCLDPASLPPDAGAVELTWEDPVRDIIRGNCLSCHGETPAPGALMSLVEYEDTQQLARSGSGLFVYQAIGQRVGDLQNPMPPRSQGTLAVSQISILRSWVSNGAPRGVPRGTPDAGTMGPAPDAGQPVDPNSPLSGAGQPVAVRSGFLQLDGVAWGDTDRVVFVTDTAQNTISAVPADGAQAAVTVRSNTGGATGIELDGQGLVAAEQGNRRVTRTVAQQGAGGLLVQEIAASYQGQAFNSPNDVAVRIDGSLYFTDPGLGLMGRPRGLSFNGVFRLPVGAAEAQAVFQGLDTSTPNGLAIAPSGSLLYLSDTSDGAVYAFDIAFDGSLTNQRLFVRPQPQPNGLALDSRGNVYVATSAGVDIYAPTGVRWGLIPLPQPAQDLDFGGEDLRTLYVTTPSTLWSVRLTVPGVL
jgi:gluconolactonase